MMHFLMHTRPIKRLAAAGEISFWQQLRFLEFMFRLSMKLPIKKMVRSHPLHRRRMVFLQKVQKQLIIDMEKEYRAVPRHRSFLTLRQHRIV